MAKKRLEQGKGKSHHLTVRKIKERHVNNELLPTNEQESSDPMKQQGREAQSMDPEQPGAERESQSEGIKATIDATNLCWKGTQSLAALYLEAAERFGYEALGLHEQTAKWFTATPWAALLKSQREFLWRYLNGSVQIARTWWQLEPTQTGAGKESW